MNIFTFENMPENKVLAAYRFKSSDVCILPLSMRKIMVK